MLITNSVVLFVFPSSAFAMHCDNRPDADYGVQKGRGASVSSAMVSVWGSSPAQCSFDLLSLLCGLGDLTTGGWFLFHTFNHSHCHGLTHVTDRKPPWGEIMEKHLLSLIEVPIISDTMRVNVWFEITITLNKKQQIIFQKYSFTH